MAITGDCASPWTHWSSFADRPQKTHVTAAFLFGYKRPRAAHDEWHPCASQPLSWLKRVYYITSEQQLTGPLLPICRRNIQMSKSMRIRSVYNMGISIPMKETELTPAKFAERLRVESAGRQLEQVVKAVKEIAASCSFSSSEIMRRTFLSQLQVTPSAYRLCFQRRSPPGTSRS